MKQLFISFLILLLFSSCDKMALGDTAAQSGSSGQGGSLARFTIVGNYLYTVDKESLKVFEISNPSDPVLKSHIPVGFEIETIYPFKDKLFIGSTSVVHIFSITDPSHPQKLSEAISPNVIRRCDPVVAKDTVAYATLRANGPCGGTGSILAVYDIKNITNPIQRNFIQVSEPYGLGYSGDVLYVCDRMEGLMVFDITQAYSPEWIKSLKDGAYIDVIPYNDLLICWVTNGMLLYDIADKRNPVLITHIQ
jgi:hypothetical protein